MHRSFAKFVALSFISAIFAVAPAVASDECTFSQSAILSEVKRVASLRPGALVDSQNLRASWNVDEGTVEYFSAGGCYDYGKAAGRATRSAEPRDADTVLKVAVELAQKFMDPADIERVSDAVKADSVEQDDNSQNKYQYISHPIGVIVITHGFADGVDTVEISWPAL